ncbi:hypothetical protein HK103_007078 [Boothiomyces macroporosus]|uniref:Uncharacterized protein n=1 Tax=Boothiomyces macroporosus TaxID=261099 RepID=A0AAD5UFV8_9FUNG|nr:hypothetical protein HK103_007078 [Boothiomyces macroporosus]
MRTERSESYRLRHDGIGTVKLPFDINQNSPQNIERGNQRLNASLAFRLRKYTPLCLQAIKSDNPNDDPDHEYNDSIIGNAVYSASSVQKRTNTPSRPRIEVHQINQQEIPIPTTVNEQIEDIDDKSDFHGNHEDATSLDVSTQKRFLSKAQLLLRQSPTRTKKDAIDRERMLQKNSKVVTKYDDIRKILGWGPSLGTQRDVVDQAHTYRYLTVPLAKPRLRNITRGGKPTGVVVITNSKSPFPKIELPPVNLY